MILQAKRDLVAAVAAYNASKRRAEPYDGQGAYRLWRLLVEMGDERAAAEERSHLLRLWGPAQLAWYGVDGEGAQPIDFVTAAPTAAMTVGIVGA